ncbi:MAG TPA: L-threonylcarbamoyladenylate synthase [Leptospiraceae bacterium]|nr:L-threonylcarbamoyladenylate synthase [Leptospiraceae bacterium]HNF15093.1 L-threonylcarbamoyladenylate synthase [Leptospiraceae bacterium]HNI98578.1 L-threonylcarbamoyladenylate synthase [Leptospiraceae bacterium]HNM06365.1 L-threonylcarbamoyladenylate synthase [Leptospiraceae bacterium]
MTEYSSDPFRAAEIVRGGGIAVFPTETVYGIGASSYNEDSCRKIYKIKNRPSDNPLIVHFYSLEDVLDHIEVSPEILEKISRLVPGPVSFVAEKKTGSGIFTSGLQSIAFRIPSLDLCRRFLKSAGPVSAPSANMSGKPSITRFRDAREVFHGKVNIILGESDTEIGLESSVIDIRRNPPLILRPGGLGIDSLKNIFSDIQIEKKYSEYVSSPGMKYRHYSPDAEVILCEVLPEFPEKDSARIGFEMKNCSETDLVLSDNLQYMHELYSFLIDSDRRKMKRIFCQSPLKDGFFDAILNRLKKASEKI